MSSSGRGARWIPVAQAQRGLQLEAALLDRPTEHVLALAQGTGARILTPMLHEFPRRQGRFTLEAISGGSGQAVAAIVERTS